MKCQYKLGWGGRCQSAFFPQAQIANNCQLIIKGEQGPLEMYLAKHCSLSFNTPNPPASNTQTINHSGVWISANYTVRVEKAICVENNTAKVLKIDLNMNKKGWELLRSQKT
jgi:hypothetical protein